FSQRPGFRSAWRQDARVRFHYFPGHLLPRPGPAIAPGGGFLRNRSGRRSKRHCLHPPGCSIYPDLSRRLMESAMSSQEVPVIEMRDVCAVSLRDQSTVIAEEVNWTVAASD